MTLPANIRINVLAAFPARVQGAGYVKVTKANGIWTITDDFTLLAPILGAPNPNLEEVVVFNTATGVYNTITIAQLLSAGFGLGNYRIVTVPGDVAILTSDVTILMDKTVGQATNIILPASSVRAGIPVTVKDYKGDANANNITFVPAAGETIDGFSAAASAANGVALIDINYGAKTLYPLTGGGWYWR
jgi:hypothetical protein